MHEKVFSRNALEHLFAIELSGMLKMLSEFPTNHQIVEQLFVRQKMFRMNNFLSVKDKKIQQLTHKHKWREKKKLLKRNGIGLKIRDLP